MPNLWTVLTGIVGYIGGCMKKLVNSMPTVASNNWKAICLGMLLNNVSQFSVTNARFHWKEKRRLVTKITTFTKQLLPMCQEVFWMLSMPTCWNFQVRKLKHRKATLPVNGKADTLTGRTCASFDVEKEDTCTVLRGWGRHLWLSK